MQGPLIPKTRGYLAEFPQPDYAFTPWASNPGAPVLVLGTIAEETSLLVFHGLRASTEHALRHANPELPCFSSLRDSARLLWLTHRLDVSA